MPGYDPQTVAFYAREAANYAASGAGGIGADLDAFLARLKPGAAILELGCGSGRDAEYMAARGFAVEPTDGVAEMAAQAAARLGRPVATLRFDELEAVERYDGVVAAYSLLHVPRDGLADVLTRIWRALKPGGWHIATYKTAHEEGRDTLGRYYNYPSEAELLAYYAAAGAWTDMTSEPGELRGYDGAVSPFVTLIVQKTG